MILGATFETGVYDTALSDKLPVSWAGTDGAGESQVMAQRKMVQGRDIISIRKLGKTGMDRGHMGRENQCTAS